MITDSDIMQLISIVGEKNVSVRHADLEAHSIDESHVTPHMPDVVVWPSSTQEIAAIVRYAAQRGLPVVPWSGGSSLEGNPVPVMGGILLALYRLNRIVRVLEDDLQVVVQPGIVYDDLNAQLKRLGLFFPPAPGSSDVATIGGMVANNSSGMRAVKYGATRDYVRKLTVVLPSGEVVDVGTRAKKSTSGYDLTSLIVGSEGTLGIVTEITLRLLSLPEYVAAVVATFDTLRDAAAAVHDGVRYGLDASAIEILDENTLHATNVQHGLSLRETPTLFVEFHGSEAGVEEQISFLRELCEDHSCVDCQVSTSTESREELWTARREAREAIKQCHPGMAMISGDVCVPISQFAAMVEYAHDLAEELNLRIYTFGHAGDGNLHTEVIADRHDAEEFARAIEATNRIVLRALDVDGTIAGEHGVGMAKREFMVREHGPSLELMRAIKKTFDPLGIMNPGKMLPD